MARPVHRVAEWIAPWMIPILLLLVWQVLAWLSVIPPRVLPSPVQVVSAAIDLTTRGELPTHLGISFRRALIGLVIGGSIGLLLGFANGLSRRSAILLDGTIQMIRNVPHLSLIPLVILWLGIGESAKIFLVALGVSFPIYINTMHGVRSVDPALIEMGRVYGLRGTELFRHVVLPGALPSLLVGVRYALGVMWLTLIVAETISSDAGIGYLAMNAREFLRTDVLVVCILLYAGLGKLADTLARWMERRWLAWQWTIDRPKGAVR
jgi:sulfonate transport system permease protein